MINAIKLFLVVIGVMLMLSMSYSPKATISKEYKPLIFSDYSDQVFDVQVNRLPHPFNLNGTLPFQVWVDGERLPLNSTKAKKIIKILDLNFTQPSNPALHNGLGWQTPYIINQKEINQNIQ